MRLLGWNLAGNYRSALRECQPATWDRNAGRHRRMFRFTRRSRLAGVSHGLCKAIEAIANACVNGQVASKPAIRLIRLELTRGVPSIEPDGSGCSSEPFRLLSSPSLGCRNGLLLVSQVPPDRNQAAGAQLSFRAVEEGGGEGLERFERGVFLRPGHSTQTAPSSVDRATGDRHHVLRKAASPTAPFTWEPAWLGARRHDKGEAMRPHRRLVHGLFAGLDFGMLRRRLCTTGSAFGSAEPNRPQILVGVVARADLPAVDVGAQRH